MPMVGVAGVDRGRFLPLELSEHYESRNHSKKQWLKPLRNSLNVSHTKFDVRDFWTWHLKSHI